MGYFKPLRRKIGVLTLVLACLMMAVWIKISVFIENISNDFGGQEKLVKFLQEEGRESGMSSIITIRKLSVIGIVVPLSLLSAWLLLSKPKTAKLPVNDGSPS